jgi:hypothetical protein
VNPDVTSEQALKVAVAEALGAKGAIADPTALAAQLHARLREVGFAVSKDYHARSSADHSADCYHCGRPENAEPFVIPGTPLELRSSEGEEGRYRHWGGDDVWVCRTHPHYIDAERVETSPWERTMDIHEALEHLAARDDLPLVLAMATQEIEAKKAAYAIANRERLVVLDAEAPNGGHQGRSASR